MRTYDVAYVQNPPVYNPPPKLEEMDLKTIIKSYLCWKSQGRISECMRCTSQCAYGKRALELAFPKPNTEGVGPRMINNKTILELAREENARKKEAEKKTTAKETVSKETNPKETAPKKSKRILIDDWYDKAKESKEPLKWIMETFNINERKAKQKVYEYKYRHPELKDDKPLWQSRKKVEETKKEVKPAETPVEEEKSVPEEKPELEKKVEIKSAEPRPNEELLAPLENKINGLMNQQAEYKAKIEELTKEYEMKIEPYRKLYSETKAKVDALYEALNILNE